MFRSKRQEVGISEGVQPRQHLILRPIDTRLHHRLGCRLLMSHCTVQYCNIRSAGGGCRGSTLLTPMLDYMLYVHIYNIYIRVDYENACDKSEVAKRVQEGGTFLYKISVKAP